MPSANARIVFSYSTFPPTPVIPLARGTRGVQSAIRICLLLFRSRHDFSARLFAVNCHKYIMMESAVSSFAYSGAPPPPAMMWGFRSCF